MAAPTATTTSEATATAEATLEPTATNVPPETPTPDNTPIPTETAIQSLTPTLESSAYNPGMGILAMMNYRAQTSDFSSQSSVNSGQFAVSNNASGVLITNTIDYTYDALGRLTAANYDSGDYYAYTYDAVGNRLTMDSTQGGVVSYLYDAANRMTNAGGMAYTYDNNGNMLSDGVNSYVYDAANRLIAVNGQTSTTYAYSGLGDRHQQNGVNYTLDLNTGLTQVLADETNTYLYGNGRIAQAGNTTEYFLGDALGSVRQLVDPTGAVTLTQSYAPYGDVVSSVGTSQTSYAFTGENLDNNGLTYLRARYYNSQNGRFISRDTWNGDYNRPLSLNRWNYVEGNPTNYTDPSGHCIFTGVDTVACLTALAVGIPVIAGVTTATWEATMNQGWQWGAEKKCLNSIPSPKIA